MDCWSQPENENNTMYHICPDITVGKKAILLMYMLTIEGYTTGQKTRTYHITHPDKASWKPGFLLLVSSPPPVLVGGLKDLDDVPSFEGQFLIVHGHVIPERLRTHHAPIAYQLKEEWDVKGTGSELQWPKMKGSPIISGVGAGQPAGLCFILFKVGGSSSSPWDNAPLPCSKLQAAQ